MMKNLDNMLIGLVTGAIIPPAVVQIILSFTDDDLVEYSTTYFENVCLFAIALNGGVMWMVLNKGHMDKAGRGILLATFAYVIAFVIYFYT